MRKHLPTSVSVFKDIINENFLYIDKTEDIYEEELTFDPRFATLLGITEEELRNYFAEHLEVFAQQEGIAVCSMHSAKWSRGLGPIIFGG